MLSCMHTISAKLKAYNTLHCTLPKMSFENSCLAVNPLRGFRSEMASGGDNGNLVQEFEEAFQVEIMDCKEMKI